MPDTLEQFFNGNLTLSQLQAGHTIVSAGAAPERVVVRDIIIDGRSLGDIDLLVGGTRVVRASTSERLTGTELIPPSGSLVAQISTAALFNRIFRCGSPSFQTDTLATLFDSNLVGIAGTANTNTNFSSSLPVNPAMAFFAASGDFFFGNNVVFRRRAGGVNGSETNLDAIGDNVCYDGSRYAYGVRAGQIRQYDTQTGTLGSAITITGATFTSDSSYGRLAAIDGMVLYSDAYNSVNRIINPTSGAAVIPPYTWIGHGSAVRNQLAVAKTAAGDYVVCRSGQGSLRWDNLGSSLASPVSRGVGNLTTPGNTGDSNNMTLAFRAPGTAQDILFFDTAVDNVSVFDAATQAISPILPISVTGKSAFGAPMGCWPTLDSAQAGTDFGTVRVRATGVRIT